MDADLESNVVLMCKWDASFDPAPDTSQVELVRFGSRSHTADRRFEARAFGPKPPQANVPTRPAVAGEDAA